MGISPYVFHVKGVECPDVSPVRREDISQCGSMVQWGIVICIFSMVRWGFPLCFSYGEGGDSSICSNKVRGNFPDVFYSNKEGKFLICFSNGVLWCIVVCGGALLWGYMVDGGFMVILLCMNMRYLCIFMHYFAYFMYIFFG